MINSIPKFITLIILFSCITEAIDALILHSDSALWLLNRKKLTRALLFEYLHARKVSISGKAEKIDVINKILEYWDSLSCENHVARCEQADLDRGEPNATFHSPIQNVVLPEQPKMGLEFAKWFYEILLGVHKQMVPGEQISNQFWKDARLRVTLKSNNATDFQEAIGDKEVNKSISHNFANYFYFSS